MSPLAEDMIFMTKIADRLHEVTVDHGSHVQAYHVCGHNDIAVINKLSEIVDLGNSVVVSISDSDGFCEEYKHLHKLGYRIAGIEINDSNRVVVRNSSKNGNFTEFCFNITLDTDWIINTWKRLDEYMNA